jgi:hypothetical protein
VQDHSGHDQRGDALQPRGLLGFHFIDSDGKSLPENDNTAVKWKLAGNAGGESNIDPVRGPIAEGVSDWLLDLPSLLMRSSGPSCGTRGMAPTRV